MRFCFPHLCRPDPPGLAERHRGRRARVDVGRDRRSGLVVDPQAWKFRVRNLPFQIFIRPLTEPPLLPFPATSTCVFASTPSFTALSLTDVLQFPARGFAIDRGKPRSLLGSQLVQPRRWCSPRHELPVRDEHLRRARRRHDSPSLDQRCEYFYAPLILLKYTEMANTDQIRRHPRKRSGWDATANSRRGGERHPSTD